MIIWLKKNSLMKEDELILTFDPPEPDEEKEWMLYSTRDHHYEEISKELDKQVLKYEKENDYRAARVARDLAKELRRHVNNNSLIN